MGFAVNFDLEDLSRVTRDFQDLVVASITQTGGTISTLTPNELLAHFGYPDAHEERAVDAGLDVVAKISQLRLPRGEPLQV
jgi:hypothetical protein